MTHLTPATVLATTGLILTTLCLPRPAGAQAFIVKDGQPMAKIVTAPDAPRTTRLAARELRRCVRKITGAELPIVSETANDDAVTIYIGESPATKKMGITADNLPFGAYRIVSGNHWLVLIGDDTDFTPTEPWPRSPHDLQSGRLNEEWDKVTGSYWGNPLRLLYKEYTGRAANFGQPRNDDDPIDVWEFDEAGSFNAVCGFLRSLGMRWYMPGDVGEVTPQLATIPLPKLDQTVKPAFPVREFCFSYAVQSRKVALWAMHLGVRNPYGIEVAHGLNTIFDRPEMMAAHPDYYALFAGKRNNDPKSPYNHVCLSSDGVFNETVRYVRTLFDHYNMDVVSVMPTDALDALCQCSKCEGKDTPERGSRGRLSDYIWDFVNRVAAEVATTHPDKKVSCCAYGTYTLPPLKIDKLHPNVQVCIVGGRRPLMEDPAGRESFTRLRRDWLTKTDNKILIFENYPFTHTGYFLPSFAPHTNAKTINATKGVSLGEEIWLSLVSTFDAPGYNHFPVYFTARMYWGDEHQNIDPMLEEYYRLFYGPAQGEMKAFFEFCEENWQETYEDQEAFDRLFALFDAAQSKVDPGSLYGKRIAILSEYLDRLKERGVKLSKATARVDVPELSVKTIDGNIVIDGKLDDKDWSRAAFHPLKELLQGGEPEFGTTFKVLLDNENIYFAVRCEDKAPLNIGTTRNEDPALWYGDVVEILLETDKHSYYQIAISPTGAVVDMDRATGQTYEWGSQAEVVTTMNDDGWTAELRLPVVADTTDPLHEVLGGKPTRAHPWYFNVCRQRIRGNEAQWSAFNPTGKDFHVLDKFARLQASED